MRIWSPRLSVSSDSAFIFLSGEYLENRNLDEIARNLALDGLKAFPDSESFYVDIEDSKGRVTQTLIANDADKLR